ARRRAALPTRAASPESHRPSRAARVAPPESRRPSHAALTESCRPTCSYYYYCFLCYSCCYCYCTTATVPTATAAIMATPSVLTFDTEGRPIKFEVWLDDLHLFLQITAKDDVSL
ncbi:unnamed protein product, partial [Closterium sp. NIES-54]